VIRDELDDKDKDDNDILSSKGERQLNTEQLMALTRQTKMIDTARRGR